MNRPRVVTGTQAEVGRTMAELSAQGAVSMLTPPEPVPGRPGIVRVRYWPIAPASGPSRWRSLGYAGLAALGILGVAALAVWWLLRHRAVLILLVAVAVGVAWVVVRVRRG